MLPHDVNPTAPDESRPSRSNVGRALMGAVGVGQVCLMLSSCAAPASSGNGNPPSDESQGEDAPTEPTVTTLSSSTTSQPAPVPPTLPNPTATSPITSTAVIPSPTPTATEPTGSTSATGPTGPTGNIGTDEVTSDVESAEGPTGAPSESADTGAPPSSDRAIEVCRRWNEDRADMREGTWSGSVENCDAGDLSSPGRENALKLVNLYRFLVDMPEVEMDPVRNQRAQECALLQSANGLSHDPPTSWKCYTQVGADAAGVSSISSGRGVLSIDLYMTDGEFNADTMGHRRWIFANSLGPVGFGSATSSCFYQADGTGDARKPFVSWPPPGPVPLQALETTEVDTAGWTIQSDSIKVADGSVTVDEAGQALAVTQAPLPGGYGSRYALRIVPTGWTLQAGHSYHVAVSGTEIDYTIDVVDCSK